MPRISLSEPALLPRAVSYASGFSLLCDDAHAACRRLCLTKHDPRVCCHHDYGQHDLGCKSRNFQRRCVAAGLMRSASSISLHSLLEEEPVTHVVVLPKFSGGRGNGQRTPFMILAALLRQRDACTLVLAVDARKGPSTQDRAERLVPATGHHQGVDGHLLSAWYC